jgi:hypothetical protein
MVCDNIKMIKKLFYGLSLSFLAKKTTNKRNQQTSAGQAQTRQTAGHKASYKHIAKTNNK